MGRQEGSDGKISLTARKLVCLILWVQVAVWHETGFRSEVTCIEQSPGKDTFAVGYADGSIRIWDEKSKNVLTTFNGHKKAVTALRFDVSGHRLASGSQDTDVILWDIIGEAGLFRYFIYSAH